MTTPLALHAVGFMARGDYAEDLHELASGGAGAFLAVGVILPSLLGIALRQSAGRAPGRRGEAGAEADQHRACCCS